MSREYIPAGDRWFPMRLKSRTAYIPGKGTGYFGIPAGEFYTLLNRIAVFEVHESRRPGEKRRLQDGRENRAGVCEAVPEQEPGGGERRPR